MQIPEIPNLIHYAIPFFILTVILEVILTVKVKLEEYDFKDSSTSILMGLGNVFLGIIAKAMVLGIFLFLYKYRIFTISFAWWSWILLLFIEDFTYYWFHRISHESRLFWASHVVHHSSKKYNLSTALRQTWSGGFYTFVFLASFNFDRISSSNGISANVYQFNLSILDSYRIDKKNAKMV